MEYDAEVITAERTFHTETKKLMNHNRELRITVWALRVSATYIHTHTCLHTSDCRIIGCSCIMYHRTI
jgi:aspartate-semialdehyde dehydrogenase